MEEFSRLVALMASLRGEDGCPWDKRQTEKAFRTFLLEEVYEVIDAIEKEDHDALKEELGDVLFHILFIAQICKEKGLFEIRDVLLSVYTKMYNRHPHVFLRGGSDALRDAPINSCGRAGGSLSSEHGEPGTRSREAAEGWRESGYPLAGGTLPVEGATQVPGIELRWEEIKRAEKGGYSPVSNVPKILPALLRSYIISKRAAKIGFDWETKEGIHEKIIEEIAEIREAEKAGDKDLIAEEIGDLLFTIANLSRFHEIDPEAALRLTIGKFVRRFAYVESKTDTANPDPKAMDELWNEIKGAEKKGK
jgi:tetrapyrrole methylase family protein/MazG family protein